jgi:arylsulfatase A-like enzyme
VIDTDFYPTMLQMAGLPLAPEHHMDGISLAPLLKNGEPIARKDIYWHYPHYADQGGTPGSAVREGDWKLIKWYEGNRIELFNLKDDIGEKNNVAASHPDVTKRLTDKLDSWLAAMGAVFPKPNPAYVKGSPQNVPGNADSKEQESDE